MKTINFKFALGILSLALVTSCNKDEVTNGQAISEQEIAEVVINSISKETDGLVTQVEKAIEMANSSTLTCSQSDSANFSSSNSIGSAIIYSTSYNWNWIYNCNGTVPDNITYNFSGNSSYDTPRMSSNDTDDYQLVVSNLDPLQSNFIVNESFARQGTQVSKVQNQYSFTSSIITNSTNINVSKTTGRIMSGEILVQINATSTSGNSLQSSGTLTFLGNNAARLTLLNGNIYNFNW
ncbi:hypothetical protein [Flavobacterium sp.]|uniref:hypothetical protein n=1 Tax=Flavobacterium sp. TaxID=239 RepID=UPI00286E29B7|nr:hypothetical protein [Flavobacterium sp.]